MFSRQNDIRQKFDRLVQKASMVQAVMNSIALRLQAGELKVFIVENQTSPKTYRITDEAVGIKVGEEVIHPTIDFNFWAAQGETGVVLFRLSVKCETPYPGDREFRLNLDSVRGGSKLADYGLPRSMADEALRLFEAIQAQESVGKVMLPPVVIDEPWVSPVAMAKVRILAEAQADYEIRHEGNKDRQSKPYAGKKSKKNPRRGQSNKEARWQ